jgi:hypothetical protein
MLNEDVAGWLSFSFTILILGYFILNLILGKFNEHPSDRELSTIMSAG